MQEQSQFLRDLAVYGDLNAAEVIINMSERFLYSQQYMVRGFTLVSILGFDRLEGRFGGIQGGDQ